MVRSALPTVFSLRDVLTRIIPGFVPILPWVFNPNLQLYTYYDSITALHVLGLLILGFISGEFINMTRENVAPVPATFQRILYHETGKEDFLGLGDGLRLKLGMDIPKRVSIYRVGDRELYYDLINQFNLDASLHDDRSLYRILIKYLDTSLSQETQRFRTSYIFVENLSISILIYVLLWMLMSIGGRPETWVIAFVSIFVSILVLGGIILIADLYARIEDLYVQSLVTEYYITRQT